MLAELGIRMINTNLCGVDSTTEFINYSKIGHPEIMGFPNGTPSDNSWLRGKKYGDPKEFITKHIQENAKKNNHMAIMFHDDTGWIDVNDKEMDYLKLVVDVARKSDYDVVTHISCYKNEKSMEVNECTITFLRNMEDSSYEIPAVNNLSLY
jgi:hypothetical protein